MHTPCFRCVQHLTWAGLTLALQACAVLGGLVTDEQLLQADRDRALAQAEFRKSEISFQNQAP